jgi:Uma2 family endonuclease
MRANFSCLARWDRVFIFVHWSLPLFHWSLPLCCYAPERNQDVAGGGVSVIRCRLWSQCKRLPTRMTVDEFLVWDADDVTGRRWQLIDGEPVPMAPAAEVHGRIQAEFGALLRNHLLATGRPCTVISAPGIVPRIRSNENFRVPDLGVTCAPPSGGVMVPEPVLLIEILSPGNEAKTRLNIWTYTTMPSVQEILAVRSTRMEVELLRRENDGNWPASPVIVRPPDMLALTSIGLEMPVDDLYRTAGLTQ